MSKEYKVGQIFYSYLPSFNEVIEQVIIKKYSNNKFTITSSVNRSGYREIERYEKQVVSAKYFDNFLASNTPRQCTKKFNAKLKEELSKTTSRYQKQRLKNLKLKLPKARKDKNPLFIEVYKPPAKPNVKRPKLSIYDFPPKPLKELAIKITCNHNYDTTK